MAVLKHTSPTASPSAPKPAPSMIVPSASTRRPVVRGTSQSENIGRAFFFAAAVRALAFFTIRTLLKGAASYERRAKAVKVARGFPSAYQVRFPRLRITMGLREEISTSLKDAMKAGDKRRV